MNQTKMHNPLLLFLCSLKEKKTLHTAAVAQECEAGMLLSYYKGGLITENNVFVFSSPALVTQCRGRKPQQLFNPAHKKAIKYLQLTESRAILVLLDSAGAKPKELRKSWSGASPADAQIESMSV